MHIDEIFSRVVSTVEYADDKMIVDKNPSMLKLSEAVRGMLVKDLKITVYLAVNLSMALASLYQDFDFIRYAHKFDFTGNIASFSGDEAIEIAKSMSDKDKTIANNVIFEKSPFDSVSISSMLSVDSFCVELTPDEWEKVVQWLKNPTASCIIKETIVLRYWENNAYILIGQINEVEK